MTTEFRPDVLDTKAIDRLRKLGGDELVGKMIELFFTHGFSRLQAVLAAWQAGDLEAVERGAHSLKSSAGNVGAGTLQNIAAEIENVAADKQTQPLPDLLSKLEEAYTKAKTRLEQEQKKLGQ